MASEIASLIATTCPETLRAPVVKVTPPAVPIPFSPGLEQLYVPTAMHIVDAVKRTLGRQ
jgi:acetoin:2,6-dichlorophenolindophenol oxidoreductase subunit beta